ncbi:MAG: rhomboid family intramembrane serine protease [Vicinamibacteria bacterium]|nr:rhomboid family intramembrane serine protease [Vicinamibacteria bacterium]
MKTGKTSATCTEDTCSATPAIFGLSLRSHMFIEFMVVEAVLVGTWLFAWRSGISDGGLTFVVLLTSVALGWILHGQRVVAIVRPQWIESPRFKYGRVFWRSIENARLETVGRGSMLILRMRTLAGDVPRRRHLTGLASNEIGLPVAALTGDEQEKLLALVQEHVGISRPDADVVESSDDARQLTEEFHATLEDLTPSAWAPMCIIALNVLIWLVMLADGLALLRPAPAELLRWGGNAAYETLHGGLWRLLTGTFLHNGLQHLSLNMLALLVIGPPAARLLGNWQFLIVYLGSGLTGSALSLHFSAQQNVSVGASGAVLGVIGAFAVGVAQHRARFPGRSAARIATNLAVYAVFSLTAGMLTASVDNATHVGGLFSGALLGWLLIEKVAEEQYEKQRHDRQIAAIVIVLVSVTGLVRTAPIPESGPTARFQELEQWRALRIQFDRTIDAVRRDTYGETTSDGTAAYRPPATHISALRSLVAEMEGIQLPIGEPEAETAALVERIARAWLAILELEQRRRRVFPYEENDGLMQRYEDELSEAEAKLMLRKALSPRAH